MTPASDTRAYTLQIFGTLDADFLASYCPAGATMTVKISKRVIDENTQETRICRRCGVMDNPQGQGYPQLHTCLDNTPCCPHTHASTAAKDLYIFKDLKANIWKPDPFLS